ncbi:MAG: LLM class flavin-dependent oxidoreductase [Actinomycetota bacterium]|nr:LLM class flavin-dependent oxidoreductase [Actinomycetota bacterium]
MTLRIGVRSVGVGDSYLDHAREAERLGAASIWTAEAWGIDAFTPLAAIATVTDRIMLGSGIAQLGARTPANLAMTAMGVQAISRGRLLLGVGTSGPQVMEGWHGVRFDPAIARTRETIEIVRQIVAGDRLAYHGTVHQLPLPDSAGRSLRSAATVSPIPIYNASLGPANLRLTGALADGWVGNSFFCETADAFFDPIRTGAVTVGRTLDDIDLMVAVSCELTDDVEEAGRRHAAGFAFTFGAMGSAGKNFYNEAFARQGHGEDVAEVQRLWLTGDRAAAAERVPIEIGLGANLIGPPDEIRRRLRQYRDCGVNTLLINPMGDTLDRQLDGLGQLLDLVEDVNAETGAQ